MQSYVQRCTLPKFKMVGVGLLLPDIGLSRSSGGMKVFRGVLPRHWVVERTFDGSARTGGSVEITSGFAQPAKHSSMQRWGGACSAGWRETEFQTVFSAARTSTCRSVS